MPHTYIITVTHNGETVLIYPRPTGREQLSHGMDFNEVCQRIGTMVMSAGISSITVYRDGQIYRQAEVAAQNLETER